MELHIALVILATILSGASGASVFGTVTSAITAILSGILEGRAQPEITLDYGTFQGITDVVTGTDNYLGMDALIPLPTALSNQLQGFPSVLRPVSTMHIFLTRLSTASKTRLNMALLARSKRYLRIGFSRPKARSALISSRGCSATIGYRPVGGLSEHQRPSSIEYIIGY